MVDIKNINKICAENNCGKRGTYKYLINDTEIFCTSHKKPNMINIYSKKCQHMKCKDDALYGLPNKKPQYCSQHKQPNMINLILENKCSVPECDEDHEFIIDNIKYCMMHCTDTQVEINIKRLCKYCDIKEESDYVCKECKKIQNKKEWAIIRYLRKVIDTHFEYNSSKMLQGCSKKRPDIYFELLRHCIIVEIDEHQHIYYSDRCECARLNEIVNGIGGKSVIIIRYNPDIIRHNGKIKKYNQSDKIDLLVKTIKKELTKEYDNFCVKLIQLFYDDNYEKYKPIKREYITDTITV
jgi:hypothetical protein